jgi:hypothetical protein
VRVLLNQPVEVITGTIREVKQMKTGIMAAVLAIGLALGMNSTVLAQAVPDEAPLLVPKNIPVAPIDRSSPTVKISLLINGKDVCDLTLVQRQALVGGVASCTKSTVAGLLTSTGALLGTSNPSTFALEIVIDLTKKHWAAVEFDLKGTKLGTVSGTIK